jgi:hypothetical protein
MFLAKPDKQIHKAAVGRLIIKKAEFAALAHIGDDLDRPAQIGISMPCRRDG